MKFKRLNYNLILINLRLSNEPYKIKNLFELIFTKKFYLDILNQWNNKFIF